MAQRIHKTAVIYPGVRLPSHCTIGAYAVIGGPPEHRDWYETPKTNRGVILEEGVRIFEFVTIHAGTKLPTIVGKDSVVFNHSHIAHDVEIAEGVTIGGMTSISGHVTIMDRAVISGGSTIIPHCVVGAYAFLGVRSVLTHHIPNAEKWIGMIPRKTGYNDVGMNRASINKEFVYDLYEEAYLFNVKGSLL